MSISESRLASSATNNLGNSGVLNPIKTPSSLLNSFGVSFAATIWTTLIGVLTVPVMLHGLGLAGYGIYSVAFSVVAFGAYLDLGLGWNTTKFVAEAHAQGRARETGTIIAAAALYSLIVGLAFTTVVVVSARWISQSVLNVPNASIEECVLAVRIAAISSMASSVNAVYVCALRGMRRFTIATVISVFSFTFSVLGAATTASLGLGLASAATAQMVGAICGLVAGFSVCWSYTRIAEPRLQLWLQMRRMFNFSLWTYSNRIMQMFVFQMDKIIMARFVGAAFFPFYSVPFNLAQRLNFLATPAVTAFYPIASVGQSDRNVFIRQYLNASRLVHVVTAAVAITILCMGDRILLVWIGPDMASTGSYFLRVLTIGFWINSVWSLDAGCIEGWNRPGLTSLVSAISLIVGLGVMLATWTSLGAGKAIALGVSSNCAALGIGLFIAWHHMARYSIKYVIRRIGLPVLEMGLIASAASFLIRPYLVDLKAVVLFSATATIVMITYGLLRSFGRDELSGMVERILTPLSRLLKANKVKS